ncbi:hypothetical protein [Actinomadura geliboluensis]|uniref:hypothetical protein n=1 Tax=Actinomadura geliboluensis TaxID=882440 RepID=UPI0014872B48|nr:hypothetical protein [Actinomadura geliboluensis]
MLAVGVAGRPQQADADAELGALSSAASSLLGGYGAWGAPHLKGAPQVPSHRHRI